MRDMRISEMGLLIAHKDQSFNKEYAKATAPMLEMSKPLEAEEAYVIDSALLMLQGVPSTVFRLREKTFTFHLNSSLKVEGYSIEVLENVFQPLMEAGSYFLYLKEFVDYFLSNESQSQGMIVQHIVLAIQDFLTFYQNQLNGTHLQVRNRRLSE